MRCRREGWFLREVYEAQFFLTRCLLIMKRSSEKNFLRCYETFNFHWGNIFWFCLDFVLKLTCLMFRELIKLKRKQWRLVWGPEWLLHWIWMLRCNRHDRKFRRTRSWCRKEWLFACNCQLVHWCLPKSTISKRQLYRWLKIQKIINRSFDCQLTGSCCWHESRCALKRRINIRI